MKSFRKTNLGKSVTIGTMHFSTLPQPEDNIETTDATKSLDAPAPATDEELEAMSICTPEDMERALRSATPEMQALLRARPREKGADSG